MPKASRFIRVGTKKQGKRTNLRQSISRASRAMLDQFRASEGFTSLGDSQLAEATLALYVAREFMSADAAVWAESPFREKPRGRMKRLDLLIDANAGSNAPPDLLAFEAKAITTKNRNAKLEEIVEDISRVTLWKSLVRTGKPLFFVDSPPGRVRGVIAVILTERLDPRTQVVPSNSISLWWDSLNSPVLMSPSLKRRLKSSLAKAKRGVEVSAYRDGGIQRSVVWAVFS